MQKPSDIKLTPAMLEAISECASPAELVQLARDNGVTMSLADAEKALAVIDRDLTELVTNYVRRDIFLNAIRASNTARCS